jgi:DNA-binding MltR family transcriptional regulator
MWYAFRPETRNALDELQNGADRAVGIVAGAIIDSALTDILRSKHRPDTSKYTKEIQDKVFEPNGPLGNFGAKIWVAYLLGYLTQEACEDLRNFAFVRNRFAHYSMHNSFETQAIKDRCSNFTLLDKRIVPPKARVIDRVTGTTAPVDSYMASPDGWVLAVADYEETLKTPKGRFIGTVKLFCAAFEAFLSDEPPNVAKHLPLL